MQALRLFVTGITSLHVRFLIRRLISSSESMRKRIKRTKAKISFNMSRVRSSGSRIERILGEALLQRKLAPRKQSKIFGRPDFTFPKLKVAVFCDSHFWHGYKWKTTHRAIHTNRAFWIPKILGNIRRDRLVNRHLRKEGWTVLRFWEHKILHCPDNCAALVEQAIMMRRLEP
jgi:DNA mismatch endonuclease Vsr